MTNSYYTTLAIIEAELGIDISGEDWSLTDAQIYDASTPTNDSFVTQASKKINDYLGTTVANQPTTPTVIEEICTALVIRMIQRSNVFRQSHGFTSISDQFISFGLPGLDIYKVELTDTEKTQLDKDYGSVNMRLTN